MVTNISSIGNSLQWRDYFLMLHWDRLKINYKKETTAYNIVRALVVPSALINTPLLKYYAS